ncbi:WD40 repeat domain-containing protein [Nocardioides zhouii]|uniref:WD40 repeat domain-containing protein n=1 Tax=Nocardioides zhouii TaxID=1168729 RepID=A0A4V1RQD7_9ACTN|nr:WD40 repeat domain-containing protein [Nocardioides zhouii]RYC12497.1 WD40 repeat domain-containing protein [Nocardioides zhouii]
MVNDLRELMRDASSHPPQDRGDVEALLGAGRRRVRVRRAGIVGGTALAAGAITLASLSWFNPSPADLAAAGVPEVAGPSIRLTDARPAVEGQDYRELTSYTNDDLDADNGQYFDGVTDDGLVLFRDGPRRDQLFPRFALMDPATGEKDWLPQLDVGQAQLWAVELGEDRLVLLSPDDGRTTNGASDDPLVHVFDRDSRRWSTTSWSSLPGRGWGDRLPTMGPDGRLYVLVPATQGQIPEGGWPMGPDGEADDANADGDTFDLWSVSPTDPTDVRDEGLRVGAIGFSGDGSLVYTGSANGAAGRVHVRDLASGEETSFDPRLGERCNLLGFDAEGERIALTQYCGTYEDGVRDDRIQVVTTEGDPVVTIQDNGVDGGQLIAGGDYLSLVAYGRATGGTYVYDFEDGRLLRLSEGHSAWAVGSGPTPGDQFLWNEPAGGLDSMFGRSGAETHLGEIIR